MTSGSKTPWSKKVVGDEELPDFLKPPVNETVLSIQFAPIAGFGIPHFGLYWSTIRDRFPNYQVMPELPSVTEQFDDPTASFSRLGIQRIELVTQPDIRCWFLDKTRTRLLQLQRDRFVHNWRQLSGQERYPRFPSVKQTLLEEWRAFCTFLDNAALARPHVNQCEVSYVNHIEYGKGWNGFGELANVIAPWTGHGNDGFLPEPERVGIQAQYRLPGNAGRLHISLLPVVRSRDNEEVLQLQITARGAPESNELDAIFRWLDLGRKWVVRGFADFTRTEMHQIWGRLS